MSLWTLKSFTAPDGKTTIVSEWLNAQDEDVQAAFLTRMKFLRGRPEDGWDRPQVGQLRHECKGLYEIVLKVNGVQHRPLGYYSGKMEFTFVAFAIERDKKLIPEGICETAKKRIKIIEENKERVRELKIYG